MNNIPVDTIPPQVSVEAVINGGTPSAWSSDLSLDIVNIDSSLGIDVKITDDPNDIFDPLFADGFVGRKIDLVSTTTDQTYSAIVAAYEPGDQGVDTASFEYDINRLPPPGEYQLQFQLTDSAGNFVSYIHPYTIAITDNVYIPIKLVDDDSELYCRAKQLDGGQGEYHTFTEVTCFSGIDGIAPDPGLKENYYAFAGSAGVRYCEMGQISYENGLMTVTTEGDCLSRDATGLDCAANQNEFDTPPDAEKNVFGVVYTNSSRVACAAGEKLSVFDAVLQSGAEVAYKAPIVRIEALTVRHGAYLHIGPDASLPTASRQPDQATSTDATVTKSLAAGKGRSSERQVLAPVRLGAEEIPDGLYNKLQAVGAFPNSFYGDAKGRKVVFDTDYSLVERDQNHSPDVYLYDAYDDSLTLVSITPDGYAANGPSSNPKIDGAGTLVVFQSTAPQLTADGSGILVYDINSGYLELIPQDGGLVPVANPSISTWPQVVVFDQGEVGKRGIGYYDYQYPQLGAMRLQTPARDDAGPEDLHHPGISYDASYLAMVSGEGADACQLLVIDMNAKASSRILCPDFPEGSIVWALDFSSTGRSLEVLVKDNGMLETYEVSNPLSR
jgi:hypothetical protein